MPSLSSTASSGCRVVLRLASLDNHFASNLNQKEFKSFVICKRRAEKWLKHDHHHACHTPSSIPTVRGLPGKAVLAGRTEAPVKGATAARGP